MTESISADQELLQTELRDGLLQQNDCLFQDIHSARLVRFSTGFSRRYRRRRGSSHPISIEKLNLDSQYC